MRTNVTAKNLKLTHEGAPATPALTPTGQLRRSVMSCLLFEKEFYEDGCKIADRIAETAKLVPADVLAGIAIEAREKQNLRHAPLLLLDRLATLHGGPIVGETIARVIQRADEMAEFLAIYTGGGDRRKAEKGKGHTLTAQVRKGLAKAFAKFDEYQLAKYDRDGVVKLRDVLRLVHPKPAFDGQAALWKRVRDRELATPETWEVELSSGKDKKETFERLIAQGKLGYFALLRNLRNMAQAGVDEDVVNAAIVARKGGAQRVLPFRYVAALRAAPQFAKALDVALMAAIEDLPDFPGKTTVLVDVSGSMTWKISGRSDMDRIDAASALAGLIKGHSTRVFTFSSTLAEVPARLGLAGADAVKSSPVKGGGTNLGSAVSAMNQFPHDRLIVITDEQSRERVPDPVAPLAYMINVASNENGVGYGRWTHIDGWSESCLRFIHEAESERWQA